MKLTYYRPQWTCGRYNQQKKVALIYNLIEGISYFFEDYSAIIINKVLCTKRSQNIKIDEIIDSLPFSEEEVTTFLDELVSYGILLKNTPNDSFTKKYRERIVLQRKNNSNLPLPNIDKNNNAERAYSKACGDNCIGSVMFELTYRCSEQCIHCYNPGATRNSTEKSHRGDRIELTLEEYKKIIDEFISVPLKWDELNN